MRVGVRRPSSIKIARSVPCGFSLLFIFSLNRNTAEGRSKLRGCNLFSSARSIRPFFFFSFHEGRLMNKVQNQQEGPIFVFLSGWCQQQHDTHTHTKGGLNRKDPRLTGGNESIRFFFLVVDVVVVATVNSSVTDEPRTCTWIMKIHFEEHPTRDETNVLAHLFIFFVCTGVVWL